MGKYKPWNEMSEEEKKKTLTGRLPTAKQKEYAFSIADALKIKRPKGDSYDFYCFIGENQDKVKPVFEKEREEFDSMDVLRYFPNITQNDLEEWRDKLNGKHGVYAFLGASDEIYYIGKSKNLFSRIPSSFSERRKQAPIKKIAYYTLDNMADTNILEIVLITENKPQLNGESNCDDAPEMFHSKIDVIKDFTKLPCDFIQAVEEEHKRAEKEYWDKVNKKYTDYIKTIRECNPDIEDL